MTEAELIEMISKKRNELEERRSGNAGSAVLDALKEEIDNLESSLPSGTRQVEEQVFLDECAG